MAEDIAGPASEAAPPATDSAVGRLVGVFVSPRVTFESIARRPTWLLPLVLWIVMSLAVTAVLVPRTDWAGIIRAQVEKSGQTATDAQIEKRIDTIKRFSWTYYVVAVIAPIAIALIPAALFWLGLKAFGWDIAFPQSLGVTTHAFLPGILSSIILLPLLWRMDAVDPKQMGDLLKSNLGILVDPKSSPALHSLLQSFDVFSLWTIALLVLGLSVAAKITRGKAAALVVTLWALYVLGKAGLAAVFG